MNHTRDKRRIPGSQLVPKEFEKVMPPLAGPFIFQSDCDRALALAVADQGYVIRSVQTDELNSGSVT